MASDPSFIPSADTSAISIAVDTINYNSLSSSSTSDTSTSVGTIDSTVPSKASPTTQDFANFKSRYISLDTFDASEDGEALAYIRALKFKNGMFGAQVFPSITDSKYKNFIIGGVGSNLVEKAQILKTNNTLQIYAFDSQVEVLNINGFLKSTIQDPWDTAMIMLWDELLRLTKLIQLGLIVEFGYQDKVYWGYPISFPWQKSSNSQYVASFSMQFVVVKRSNLLKNQNQVDMASYITTQVNNASQ